MRLLHLIVPAALMLSACGDRGTLVRESWTFSDGQWLSGDAKSVSMTVDDTAKVYRIDLDLKHGTDYGYQNLYVRTVTTYPSGKTVSSVTSLELAEKSGEWAGDCGGSTCTISLPLQAKFTFPETGTYAWAIEPYMRTDTVSGIRRLTVTCSEASE
jgi:gliding motility-associated lipoprotein GldH